MRKIITEQLYSMSDLVNDILKEREPRLAESPQWILDKKKNDVKKIHNILLPSLDLASFIEEYENHKRTPYNYEWKDFFKSLLEYDEKTPNESNSIRDDIRKKNHTIYNTDAYYKLDIFDYLVKAISKGKTPDIYLQKLQQTKICEQSLIKSNLLVIWYNINTILNATSDVTFFERNSRILTQIRIIFNDYINISADGTLNANVELSLPESVVQNTEMLINEMNKPCFKQNLVLSVLRADIETVVHLYSDKLIEEYETNGYSHIVRGLQKLHNQILEVLNSSYLPGVRLDFRPIELSDIASGEEIYWRNLVKI